MYGCLPAAFLLVWPPICIETFLRLSARRYLIARLDAVSHQPYVIVWVQTGATYRANCPGAWWLYSTYHRLPERCVRLGLYVYVLFGL